MQQARQELRARPDDIELMAALAVAESRSGYFADAAGSFALCEGAQLYEDLGLEAHANVLRALGDGGQAAALRLQRQLSPLVRPLKRLRELLALRLHQPQTGMAWLLEQLSSLARWLQEWLV